MAFEDEIGVLAPLGFFDPLGLCADGDEVVFARRRAVELKHGRVSMLAVTGYVVAEIARFPGAIDLDGTTFNDIPNGLAAITAIPCKKTHQDDPHLISNKRPLIINQYI
jgi:Chlorophyll A-B binding protein